MNTTQAHISKISRQKHRHTKISRSKIIRAEKSPCRRVSKMKSDRTEPEANQPEVQKHANNRLSMQQIANATNVKRPCHGNQGDHGKDCDINR